MDQTRMRRPHPKPDVEDHRTGGAGKRGNRVVARALVVLLAIPLGFLVTAPSLAAPTEAAWQRSVMTGGKVTAGIVPVPRHRDKCFVGSLIGLGTGVVIYWDVALNNADLGKAKLYTSPGTTGAPMTLVQGFDMVANTRSTGQQHSTLVPTGLLTGLVGGNRQRQFHIVIDENGWTAGPLSVTYSPGVAIGLLATCDNVTPR